MKHQLTNEQRALVEQAADIAKRKLAEQEALSKGGVEIKPKEEQFSYNILIGVPDGSDGEPRVIMDFNRTVKWFSLSADQALELATIMKAQAEALRKFLEKRKEEAASE